LTIYLNSHKINYNSDNYTQLIELSNIITDLETEIISLKTKRIENSLSMLFATIVSILCNPLAWIGIIVASTSLTLMFGC
jgi:hypothetical protein